MPHVTHISERGSHAPQRQTHPQARESLLTNSIHSLPVHRLFLRLRRQLVAACANRPCGKPGAAADIHTPHTTTADTDTNNQSSKHAPDSET